MNIHYWKKWIEHEDQNKRSEVASSSDKMQTDDLDVDKNNL